MNPLTQGNALGYKYYALSGHVFVRLDGSERLGGGKKSVIFQFPPTLNPPPKEGGD
jgi:hypothetical protein